MAALLDARVCASCGLRWTGAASDPCPSDRCPRRAAPPAVVARPVCCGGPMRIALAQAEAWSGAGERSQPIGRAPRLDQAATADLEAKLAAIRASAPPLELRSDPERHPADVARIAELEAQIDRARRTIEFFTSAPGTPFDWEAWLRGETEMHPPHQAGRIAALETALAALISRVRATGGYASPEEQDALWRAEQLLAHRGGP